MTYLDSVIELQVDLRVLMDVPHFDCRGSASLSMYFLEQMFPKMHQTDESDESLSSMSLDVRAKCDLFSRYKRYATSK